MLLNEAIMGRHSIRSFRPDPVEKSLLLTLADAAQQAPSASNLQAWRFLFITDQQLKEKVDLFSPGLSGKPPVILVICSDMHKAARLCKIICEKYPENDAYHTLLGCIDADKGKALTEPEGFAKMLEKASEMLVDCL